MKNNAKAVPYVNMDAKLSVRAVRRSEFDISAPEIPAGGDYRYQHVQGGCEANNILFSCMVTGSSATPEKCRIAKADLTTGRFIGYSEEMELGHANDAVFDPETNTIAVADCTGKANKVYILDADTLARKDTVELAGGAASLAYDNVNQRYIGAGIQNDFIYVYDRNFHLIKKFPGFLSREESGEYSQQGILTDGVYVYLLEWHGGHRWPKENITIESEVHSHFLVFELETGRYAGMIDLGIRREVEYAIYWNEKIYIGCNNIRWNGMEFYEVDITPEA